MKKGLKKTLKGIGWTLLGLVLAVVITACVAMYVVFTPEHLTPIARKAADKYITCQHEIGEVELTFFSTFPRFGLRADGLLLINPMEGAQSDTVVYAPHLTATVDVMEFINNKNLHIHEAILDDAQVNFYIAPNGTTNLTDVFVSSPDSATEDTTAFSLPFNELRVEGLRLKAQTIVFVDDKDTITASLGTTELSAKADNWDDMLICLDAHDVCATLQGDTYADSLHVELIAPMAMNLDSMHFAFDGARLAVNDFDVRIEGDVTLGDTMAIDANVSTGQWQIKPLLALVPEKFTSGLKDIDIDGKAQLDAVIRGQYSATQWPLITARLLLEDGEGQYKPLPYTLRDIQMDATADLNLNEGQSSSVTLRKLQAQTKQSTLAANGRIENLLGNMLLDLKMDLDANLPDFAYFLPKEMTLTGKAAGTANAKIRLDDLTNMQLHKGRISADMNLTDIHYAMDSMLADLPQTHARLQIPNSRPSKAPTNWVGLDLNTRHVDFAMDTTIRATLGASVIRLEASNVLAKGEDYFLSLTTDQLHADYDTIHADLQSPSLEAFLSGGKRMSAKLNTAALRANMEGELSAKTDALVLEAAARYNQEGENMLLQWNPRLKIQLKNGELNLPERLPETVYIPTIDFSYSNREMTIADSRIELGHSDINLKGYVRHIGKWFRHQEVLEGELELVSNHCDANQLMEWFSADEGSEEKPKTESQESKVESEEKSEADPFLVPTDVNLALNTHMQEVEIFNQLAKDLKGGIYIQDGKLILDEVGFVCRAAKLQLTAMYRTPRRSHLYLGFDYHMIDVDIDELLTMIPNLEEMVPMLSSFQGAAEFHLAAETYLNSQYQPKMSTLRGAASLTAQDLVVLDGETFDKISKLLLFNKKTVNRIDSINAEMTIYKNEIDLYPLCVQMDNYMVALGGRHNTNMTFDYDINVLSPIYLGVNVSGTMDDLKIQLAKCKFAEDFRPHWYQKTDTLSRELRERIKQSMERNVRIR